jgi:hypothetical protein
MTTPNIFSFRLDGGRIVLAVPGWYEPDEHFPNRATAERMLAELTACLGVPAAWPGVKSSCCGAEMVVGGSVEGETHWYECSKCGNACDGEAGPVK